MEAATWTLIALLTATLGVLAGALFQLRSRIDGLGDTLNARIDGLGDTLNARIDGFGDSLSARIDAQGVRIDRLIEQVAELTAAVRVLTTSVDAHLQAHAG